MSSCSTDDVTEGNSCIQVVDIPGELIEPHDITVDIILTPRRIIYCPGRLPRPGSLIWGRILNWRHCVNEMIDMDAFALCVQGWVVVVVGAAYSQCLIQL